MKKIIKLLTTLIPLIIAISCTSCGNKKGEPYTRKNLDYFFALDETNHDLSKSVDKGLTTEWCSTKAGQLGVKSYRIWVDIDILFQVDSNDNITVNQNYKAELQHFVDKLKENGVERFSAFGWSLMHVKEDKNMYGWAVPSPYDEFDKYSRFLKVQAKAYGLLAKEFPDIEYFEPMNEPDQESGAFLALNGYQYGADSTVNEDFLLTTDEIVHVMGDICYNVRKEVKANNPNAKVLLPALTNYSDNYIFLDKFYNAIESKTLPNGSNVAVTDPDEYFDILNWHPYNFGGSGVYDGWVDEQNLIHDVAVKHGDAEKPVWFTEIGYFDNNENGNYLYPDDYQKQIGEGWVETLDTIKNELPYVETVFFFRLTNMYTQDAGSSENTFGLFYNPDDPVNKGNPKPAAISIFHYINGENADDSILYNLEA